MITIWTAAYLVVLTNEKIIIITNVNIKTRELLPNVAENRNVNDYTIILRSQSSY